MRKTASFATAAISLAALFASASMLPTAAGAADAETIKMGKEVAFDRRKGNCLACHMMGDGESPGDIGPPLIAMKARFPDPAKLRAQIWDPMVANPDTRMPAFGKYEALSGKEIDAIVAYLYTL
ncbi:MAG: sulfur oxidation c-type cytochrome SoxX [Chromatiaceae bacterium]|nr:sulfur oxidation c-type cytochrome SoxX [Gammaproteobacteria bacterium]MCP5312889.1 sulfur oxidation c-type cytochrome SoxX [Chromatiaceae bacterium]